VVWEVVGQERAVSLLKRGLANQSLSHAYLFTGPEQVGKRTLALVLARALNCLSDNPPCGNCDVCRKIAAGRHADVQVITLGAADTKEAKDKPQTEIGIGQIRDLQHAASLPPFEGRYKVFIIDGAEMMSGEAANALLKTLEEPVGRVVFILLTTSERRLPATIVSRCQRLELAPLNRASVAEALTRQWGVEVSKAALLAGLSRGALGWAVQAVRDEDLLQSRVERFARLDEVISGGIEARFSYARELSRDFGKDREEVAATLDLWLGWWRDLLLAKIGCPELVVSRDRLSVLAAQVREHSLGQIRDFIGRLQAASVQLRCNANPQLVLEVLLLNIPGRGA
jgi:DNA polymerase-3 subunit delta'